MDIESCSDTGGGNNIGYIANGEWLEYTVNVTAGTCNFTFRVASESAGGSIRALVDGTDLGAVTVPVTGGWQTWTNVTLTGKALAGGNGKILRLEFPTAGFNLNNIVSTNHLAVTLTSPTNGAVFFTTNLVGLAASAGAVTNLQFYSGATRLATFTNAPYSLTLSNLAPGPYAFYAIATANTGLRITSAVANIIVGLGTLFPTLIPQGAIWNYFDQTNDLGTAWRSNTFDDTSWKTGPAMLGFDDLGGILPTTMVSSNKQWTTYFRRQFYVLEPGLVTALAARLTRDDGVVVYLNGAEIWRDTNMPSGTITNQTPALSALGGTDETNWLTLNLLTPGWNQLAAEVHQVNLTSSDVGFDFELTGTAVFEQRPALTAALAGSNLVLSATEDATYFTLCMATNLSPPVVWTPAQGIAVLSNKQWRVTLTLATNGARFLRMRTQ